MLHGRIFESMGQAELYKESGRLVIRSVFYFYGEAAGNQLALQIAEEIAAAWNEPAGTVVMRGSPYTVRFDIEGIYEPELAPETIWYNDNPLYNYFRIEEYSAHDISFVDEINCNTGYFKLANLLNQSTTAAHEYGHTLGLDHPRVLDIRGQGRPGIMYPRGTVCDPAFQYDPRALPLQAGGTMDPRHRKVRVEDIADLRLHRLNFDAKSLARVGDFSSIYHERHA